MEEEKAQGLGPRRERTERDGEGGLGKASSRHCMNCTVTIAAAAGAARYVPKIGEICETRPLYFPLRDGYHPLYPIILIVPLIKFRHIHG